MFFLCHLKSSFRSVDIQVFVFPSSSLFLPVSHCFRGCLKINLKVHDVINCLNKNLKHILFVKFIFSFEPSPFNGQSDQKQKRPGTSDQSLFRLQTKFRKISLLVIYYLTKFDDVIKSGF